MKVIIFGSTGTLGSNITQQALAMGHTVTGFARHADSADITNPDFVAVNGNVFDADQVKAAIAGHDAVIFAVGAGAKGGVRSRGTAVVMKVMKELGVSRLIVLSTLGAGDSRKHLNFLWKYVLFGFLLRQAYIDHQLQERLVRQSGLDWTIVRPSAFTDEVLENDVHCGTLEGITGLALKIPRKTVASFMVSLVDGERYLHEAPAVSC